MIDQKQLIGQVAAKNGIRLEPDDPAFALVTLNEAASGRVGGSDAGDSAGSQQLYGIMAKTEHSRRTPARGCEDGCRRVAARTELRHRKSQPESACSRDEGERRERPACHRQMGGGRLRWPPSCCFCAAWSWDLKWWSTERDACDCFLIFLSVFGRRFLVVWLVVMGFLFLSMLRMQR